ncbi:selenophosphate synthase [Lentibacillus persicus]|uniref:Selenide, water dikinase n=1 Tax=Lentibacillus persicus TaxID=640948 RepID=A0A1I1YEX4_9BACI|nr:selenide, water dikinase SelD [Lentibacillus persicus]SFE16673.1 selenophosphate synthase [Lentibacillus persicus]
MANAVKLTSLSSKGGCGCKIGPAELENVLHSLPQTVPNPNLLVGLDTSDDAGVYKLTDDLALVQTVDFFTPIVDDPYAFGQVAAANAISDVYAMGGTPITALNIVAFPISTLDESILADILRGAGDKLKEAGVSLAGGHSIEDEEPKFGLAVTGTVHPDNVKTNTDAKPGDKLILTKPIGVGILSSSLKRDLLKAEEIDRVTQVMATLNKTASETMNKYNVHASTDVTGFGLLGHASEIAAGSNVEVRIDSKSVPVLPRAKELAEDGVIPGGTKNNFTHIKDSVTFPEGMNQIDKYILCDAVTSGGLLISADSNDAEYLLDELQQKGVEAQIIGDISDGINGHITVN